MRIHAPANPVTGAPHPLRRLFELAAPRIHRWTEDPAAADLIFLAPGSSADGDALTAPPLARKCVVLAAGWEPPFRLASPETHDEPDRANPLVEAHDPATTVSRRPDLLASFVGDHPRDELHDGLFALAKDRRIRLESRAKVDPQRRFYDLSLRSKFILCPRGTAAHPASLLAAMKLGIAPVILSDDWVPLPGPHWEEFAVFVSEDDVSRLPAILAGVESTHWLRGEMAQEAYRDFFSPPTYFNHLVASVANTHGIHGLSARHGPPVVPACRLIREACLLSPVLLHTS